MSLPFYMPYSEVVTFLLIVGGISVAATSAGALIRAWSWKVPQTLGLAFLGVIAAFILIAWLFVRFAG